jgi:hypothetical protein
MKNDLNREQPALQNDSIFLHFFARHVAVLHPDPDQADQSIRIHTDRDH